MVWYQYQNMKNWHKIQYLKIPSTETKENIHIDTKEFKIEPVIPLDYKTEEEQPKSNRKLTLIYPFTTQE